MTVISLEVFIISVIIAFVIGALFGITIICYLMMAGKADKERGNK